MLHHAGENMEESSERIPTNIVGLDELMENGIPKNYVVLISGRAGTMKSSVAYNILMHSANNTGTLGMYLTLEQSSASLMEHMKKLGLYIEQEDRVVLVDLAKARRSGMLETGTEPGGQVDWLSTIINFLKSYQKQTNYELLVLDSLSAIYVLANMENARSDLFNFFEGLRELNITTFIISEVSADKAGYGPLGIEEFLADGILHLKVREDGDNANLFVSIPKMRKTLHPRKYFPLIFENGHFEIVKV
jgi:KaiC/GvpD/RAD55 family RecA-like ATPase